MEKLYAVRKTSRLCLTPVPPLRSLKEYQLKGNPDIEPIHSRDIVISNRASDLRRPVAHGAVQSLGVLARRRSNSEDPSKARRKYHLSGEERAEAKS